MSDVSDTKNFDQPYKKEGYIDYKALPFHKARIKFYNPKQDKKFGFVTILGDGDKPIKDAYLSGAVLEKAGIYEVSPNDLVNVKYVLKEKGDAVVMIQRYTPPSEPTDSNKE